MARNFGLPRVAVNLYINFHLLKLYLYVGFSGNLLLMDVFCFCCFFLGGVEQMEAQVPSGCFGIELASQELVEGMRHVGRELSGKAMARNVGISLATFAGKSGCPVVPFWLFFLEGCPFKSTNPKKDALLFPRKFIRYLRKSSDLCWMANSVAKQLEF